MDIKNKHIIINIINIDPPRKVLFFSHFLAPKKSVILAGSTCRVRIEFLVLKAVAFHFDVLMPLEYLDQQTDRDVVARNRGRYVPR